MIIFSRFAESLVEFMYEYDDFFRLIGIIVIYNGVRLQPQKYQFDLRQGRLTKLNNFSFLYDFYRRRIIGETVISFTHYVNIDLIRSRELFEIKFNF